MPELQAFFTSSSQLKTIKKREFYSCEYDLIFQKLDRNQSLIFHRRNNATITAICVGTTPCLL
jgi:hypothetical protein